MRWWSWLLLLLVLCAGLPARAQTYAADASAANATQFPWIDISSNGTALNLGDDAVSGSLSIGFNFTFGRTTYTTFQVMSNGQVRIGVTNTSTAFAPAALPLDGSSGKPSIDAVLMPLWDDFNARNGDIRYRLQGTAPNRVLVVAWIGVPYYCSGGSGCSSNRTSTLSATFQVQIHEQGFFVYRYGAVDGSGGAHTAGPTLSNAAGGLAGYEISNTDFVQYAFRSAVLTNGRTIVWRFVTPTLVSGQRYSFESHDLAGAFIKQESPLGWMRALSTTSSAADKAAASFIMRPGLADSSCWSFESVNQPGFYLRHSALRLQADAYSNASVYLQDATFCLRAGRAASAKLTFVSYNYPGHYIRRLADGTVGIGTPDGSADYDGRATFEPETALADLPALRVAQYRMEENSWNGTAGELKDSAGYTGGPFHGQAQGSPVPTLATASPARAGTSGTCGYAVLPGPDTGGGSFVVNGLPLSTTTAARTSVSFWMYWTGGATDVPIGFQNHGLAVAYGVLGFSTNNGDILGVATTGMQNTWVHVVAVFNNGTVNGNKLYVNGVLQALTQRSGAPDLSRAVVASTAYIGAFGAGTTSRFEGRLDEVQIYQGELTQAEVTTLYNETHSCVALTKLLIEHASGTGLTCAPSTLTVRACQDAACSTPFTGGLTGTMTASGGTVVWPDGAGFSIAAGSSSTTVRMQSTTTTATLVGATASAPTSSSATTCNFGSPSCTFTAAASALVVTVPDHVAETSATMSISAVGSSGGSCTSALASTMRSINVRCSYVDPSTGTLPVRLSGGALNSGNSAASACDGTGRTVSLSFDAGGVATTSLLYADAGKMRVTATYTGGIATADIGLTMTGSAMFTAAPDHFTIDGITAGPIRAGANFAATLTARNAAGATTPNHGRESAPQRASIDWVKLQPTGSGSVAGSFSGNGLRSFTSGAVTASDLNWTEVGRGDLVARGSDSNGYLGSGLQVFGSSRASGARSCAVEGGNCVLPGGTTATVYYGAPGGYAVKTGQSGTVACNNSNFGDPLYGTVKRCYYVASAATNGSVGDFIPQRFSVSAGNACGAFTYAGQPTTATVTALNAAGNPTLNFNGTATTSPAFAQAVSLSDANGLGLGTLSGGSIAASGFSAGVGSTSVSYAFTSKTTSPQSLQLRASNGGSGASLISSSGGTEPVLALRSGRLRLSNAFGTATAALQLAAVTEYWNGSAWLLNSADNCTTLAAASVALSNARGATGAATAATTSAGALAISGGNGTLTLAAPTPAGSSLSLDVALNLGSTTADQSCHAAHPATTGANLAWLRALNGSCAITADRDPAARASFGIFAPETRKTVHVRDLY